MTAQEALLGLAATDPEVQTTTLRTIFQLPAMPELYGITVLNLDSPNQTVVFFSLDMLIKKYTWQLQRDAAQLLPKLLTLLSSGNGPVTDRTMMALTVAGDRSVAALLAGIGATVSEHEHAMLLWALARNGHAWQHVVPVLATLRTALHGPSYRIQTVALYCLIDFMRPLLPTGLGFVGYDFAALLPELRQVGQTLLEQARLESNERETELLELYLAFLPPEIK